MEIETTRPTNRKGIPLRMVGGWHYPSIIAFSGKYGTGKDTAVQAVIKHLKSKCANLSQFSLEHLKFADALKVACAVMSGMTAEDQYSSKGKVKEIPDMNMTVARFQQVLGTVAREHIHPDIWIFPVMNRARVSGNFTIISDCRFINEAINIQKAGGIVIRLNRPYDLISKESKAGRDPEHISETCLDDYEDFDLVVQNEGANFEYIQTILGFLDAIEPDSEVSE